MTASDLLTPGPGVACALSVKLCLVTHRLTPSSVPGAGALLSETCSPPGGFALCPIAIVMNVVVGYENVPFLRLNANGVARNEHSPAT